MNQDKITLRQGKREDCEILKGLFSETIKAICSSDYNSAQIATWISSTENEERWDEIMHAQTLIVAEIDHVVVGFITLKNGNYIDLLYVHKDFQKQGVASELLPKIETAARHSGQHELFADVSITAKPFFERHGFQVMIEQQVERNGVELKNFKMFKRLVELPYWLP